MAEVIAIVVAAGGSTRMGRSKALLPLDGEPLVVRHVQALLEACTGVRVVVGCQAESIRQVLPEGTDIVENPNWATTETRHSIALALKGLPSDTLIIVTPVDTPPAPHSVLSTLIETGAPAVPSHNGKTGHPVLIRCEPTRSILANGTLRDAVTQAQVIPVEWPDVCTSFNTPEEWTAWLTTRLPERP